VARLGLQGVSILYPVKFTCWFYRVIHCLFTAIDCALNQRRPSCFNFHIHLRLMNFPDRSDWHTLTFWALCSHIFTQIPSDLFAFWRFIHASSSPVPAFKTPFLTVSMRPGFRSTKNQCRVWATFGSAPWSTLRSVLRSTFTLHWFWLITVESYFQVGIPIAELLIRVTWPFSCWSEFDYLIKVVAEERSPQRNSCLSPRWRSV
jgi:hypothetical protein